MRLPFFRRVIKGINAETVDFSGAFGDTDRTRINYTTSPNPLFLNINANMNPRRFILVPQLFPNQLSTLCYKVLRSDTKVGILPHAKSAEIYQLLKNAEF